MTHVASKQLCQELYELSGWEPENWYDSDPDSEYLHTYEDVTIGNGGELLLGVVAAYDLGYLLRKIGEEMRVSVQYCAIGQKLGMDLKEWEGKWIAYTPYMRAGDYPYAEIPEDAAIMLAIKLLKQGVLKPSDKEET